MPYSKIMLCTDGSEYAVGAERVALTLAKRCSAELTGYSVVEWNEDLTSQLPQHLETRASTLKVYHEELKRRAIEQDIVYEYIIDFKEEPVISIAEQAERLAVELIVMGRHGRRGLLKLLIGSVTQGVIAHTMCHVCVAPRAAEPKGEPVIVAVDGSESSRKAGDFSLSFAERYQPKKIIYLLVKQPNVDTRPGEELLEELYGKAKEKGFEAEKLLLSGMPFEVICITADKVEADFIVMGSRGLTGIKKVVLGSTSERVAGLTNRAVIIVK